MPSKKRLLFQKALIWAILCPSFFIGCASAPLEPDTGRALPTTAFIGVRVLTMAEAEERLMDQTVLVRGDRIVEIGPADEIDVPEDALRIDGAGKFLLPGLADMHVHLEYFEDPAVLWLFLANGVTTVRNMDGRPYLLEWKKQIARSELPGPTIHTAGPLLDGDPPLRPDNTVVRDAPEARTAVAEQAAAGYDFIKVYTNLSSDAYRAILAAAEEHDLPVAGHVPRGVELPDALRSGQVAIEHLGDHAEAVEADDSPFADGWHWSKRFLAMPFDPDKARKIAEFQAERGVWSVPTLVQADRELAPADAVRAWLEAPEMAYVDSRGRQFWVEQSERFASRMDAEDWALVAQGRQHRLDLTRTLHQAGVSLLVGTDTPNPFVVPGFAIHEELKNFVAAGLTPAAALAAATREAALFLGESEEWGTVEPGKRADLLLLDADPLAEIENTRQLAGVMVRGRWLSRHELDRKVEELRQVGGP